MLRPQAAFPPCWNWAPVRSALSLWQGTTMLWGYLDPQRGRSVQWGVAAPPGTRYFPHPQRIVRTGRSIVQDWPEGRASFLSPTPSWSPKVSQPAMTPSTSHTCRAMPPLWIQTVSVCPLMWPRLLKLEGECWGWMEIWRSVPMWSRDVGVAWSSRGTLSKPTRLIRFKAHHRHDARSGSEYDADITTASLFFLYLIIVYMTSFLQGCFSETGCSEKYRVQKINKCSPFKYDNNICLLFNLYLTNIPMFYIHWDVFRVQLLSMFYCSSCFISLSCDKMQYSACWWIGIRTYRGYEAQIDWTYCRWVLLFCFFWKDHSLPFYSSPSYK